MSDGIISWTSAFRVEGGPVSVKGCHDFVEHCPISQEVRISGLGCQCTAWISSLAQTTHRCAEHRDDLFFVA